MLCLLILMLALAANSMFLPGAEAGLKYYLYPDFNKVFEKEYGSKVSDKEVDKELAKQKETIGGTDSMLTWRNKA